MKVIVKESGFYGGTWHEAGTKPQEMADGIARAFLPPHGRQLEEPSAKRMAGPAPVKTDEKKAD